MASREEELNFRVSADTRQAATNIDALKSDVSDLEDKPHEVDVTADTAKAEAAARQLDQRLEGLTTGEKRVVLELMARRAQQDLDRFNKDLAQAEKFSDQELQLRISARDDATRKLDAIQSEIREIDGATPTVDVDVRTNGLDNLRSLMDDLDSRAGGIGARLAGFGVGSPAVAGAGLFAGALFLAAQHSADVAIRADEIAKLTGDSVENASRIAAVFGASGVEAKDLQDIMLQLGGVLSSDAELVARLGINMNDGRSLGERFVQVVELLGEKFDNAGERSVIASQLFGEEGVRQVNTVIARVGDLSEAIANVPQAQIIHPNDVQAARDAEKNMANIKADAATIGQTLGRPALQLFAGFTSGAAEVGRATQEVGLDIARFFSSARQENDRIITAFNESEQAAASFDQQLLDGLTTFDQVRQKVIELTGDQHAANLVAIAWAESTGWLNEKQQAQAGTMDALRSQQDRYVEGLEAANREAQESVERTAEQEEALRNLGAEYANLAERIVGAIEGRFGDLRKSLRQEELWADVIDQLGRVEEAAKQTGEEGEESALDHGREVRRLRGMVLDLLETYENLPASKVVEILTLLETGNIEAALDELTKNRFIHLGFVMPSTLPGFDSGQISVGNNAIPSIVFAPNAQASSPQVIQQTTNYYPNGATPEVQYNNDRIFQRRGGLQ